jgi:DNA-binding transcriptional LysR family regulator
MNLRKIDLNLLVVFDAIIAERSITRAAQKVGISQSAMSHALGRLSQTFRDDLVRRRL